MKRSGLAAPGARARGAAAPSERPADRERSPGDAASQERLPDLEDKLRRIAWLALS